MKKFMLIEYPKSMNAVRIDCKGIENDAISPGIFE
jgi:hypothetical protein